MAFRTASHVCLLGMLALSFAASSARAGEPDGKNESKPDRPAIYDTKADGGKQIADALVKARADNKRVLLKFGANWCGWCHKLHAMFKDDKDIARKLMYEYEVVLIDVDVTDKEKGTKHNADIDAKYGNPTKEGLPVLVVLDAEGKQLVTQETGALEEGDHHNPAKVMEFLTKWQPAPLAADRVLADALAQAKSGKKKVFLHLSAPWCGYCHKLGAFLAKAPIAKEIGAAFVVVKIDVERMTGGKELDARYRDTSEAAGGLPFIAVLDAEGKKLADGVEARGNIGFPMEPHEIEHFMKMMRDTSGLKAEQLAVLEKELRAETSKRRNVETSKPE